MKKSRIRIDLVRIGKQKNIVVRDMRVYGKPECGSDHYFLIGKCEYNRCKKKTCIEEKSENEQEKAEHDYKIKLL